jgi:hypothetical protein
MEAELLYLFSRQPKGPQPLARLAFTTSTPVSGYTPVAWDTFTVNVKGVPTSSVLNGMIASSSGIIVPIDGYYEISGAITFSSSSTVPYVAPVADADAYATISVNGSDVAVGAAIEIASVVYDYASFVSDVMHLTAGADTVTLAATGSSGTHIWGYQDPLAVTGIFLTYMSAIYVGS